MLRKQNSSSLSIFLLVLLLLISVSIFITSNQINRKLEQCSLPSFTRQARVLNPAALYTSHSAKEVRKSSFKSADQARKLLIAAAKLNDNKDFYAKVKTEAHCENMERIGESGDGGKYVCNPKMVRNGCTLMSLGLNNQIEYDEHIHKATGKQCIILGADIGEQNEKTKESYKNINGQLFVGKIPDNLPISSMLEKSGRSEIELLKMDIENGEFTALEPLIKDYFVCQIFIEIHGTPLNHFELLQTMAKYGFRIFNVDPNPYCEACCEYSLINDFCMAQFEVTPLASIIPPVTV